MGKFGVVLTQPDVISEMKFYPDSERVTMMRSRDYELAYQYAFPQLVLEFGNEYRVLNLA